MLQTRTVSTIRSLLVAAACCTLVLAGPIDNDVEGDPVLTCGESSISLTVKTRNALNGHVFVKGLYANPDCRVDTTENRNGDGKTTTIKLDWYQCDVKRRRSATQRGIFITSDIVVSFSPQFITKIDRIYSVSCFYMEATTTCETDLNVEMLTTQMQTQVVPMPVCRYEVLTSPVGQPIYYAQIGQSVYHKWTCDTETENIFCMTVHSCKVDDGSGDVVQLLDKDGCSLDQYLLGNIEYLTDLMAGKEAHVFKYADRPNLYFDCQITIVVKEPGQDCPRPDCTAPLNFSRTRRSAKHIDVVENVTYTIALQELVEHRNDWLVDDYDESLCMGIAWFSLYAIGNILGLIISSLMILSSCRSRIHGNVAAK